MEVQDEWDAERLEVVGPYQPVSRGAVTGELLVVTIAKARSSAGDLERPLTVEDHALDGGTGRDRSYSRVSERCRSTSGTWSAKSSSLP